MKTKLIIAMFAFFLTAATGFGQFTFGVSPGLNMNRAYFGYKMNRIVPFAGCQFYNSTFNFKFSYEDFDYDLNQIVTYEDEGEARLSLIMPNLGVKYFIKETGNLKAHLTLNVSKPILSGKVVYNGEEDDEIKDAIKNLKLFGGEFGFGAEYFFDENFSLGGEFGIRYMMVRYKDSYETSVYNPNTGMSEPSENTYEFKSAVSPTFSKISLNFYF